MNSDKYFEITQKTLVTSDRELLFSYHSSCHKNYTAVKHRQDTAVPNPSPNKKPCIEKRRCSVLPKSDEQGLLKGTCIFCGKCQKKKNGKEKPRLKVATIAGCESLRQRVNWLKNERVKSLIRSGVDLEGEYHKSCRIQFLNETADQDEPPQQRQSYHKDAFANLVAFIQCEVLEKHLSVLVSNLQNMYREEYTSLAGEEKDVHAYTAQNLTRKLKEHFMVQIKVSLIKQWKGNFIYCSSMSEEDAHNNLNEVGQRYEEDKLRWAASPPQIADYAASEDKNTQSCNC